MHVIVQKSQSFTIFSRIYLKLSGFFIKWELTFEKLPRKRKIKNCIVWSTILIDLIQELLVQINGVGHFSCSKTELEDRTTVLCGINVELSPCSCQCHMLSCYIDGEIKIGVGTSAANIKLQLKLTVRT